MKKAGLLELPRRGYLRITDRGLEVLKQNPPKIDVKFLFQFKEFRDFRAFRREKTVIQEEIEEVQEKTP